MFVVEAESNEELNQLVSSLPAWLFVGTTATPLQTFKDRLAHNRRLQEKMKARAG